jgi:DNA polymerase III alpha subunit (gram-positive type)
MSDKRDLIVVDTETTGLDPDRHWVLEVAAVNVTTGEELYFVPALPQGALDEADGKALKINGYFERSVFAHRLNTDAANKYWRQLWSMLAGNTLAGSNPKFDADMMNRSALWSTMPSSSPGYGVTAEEQLVASPWHHRLADLSAYAAGALYIDPAALPGLDVVCRSLHVTNDNPHSALDDARATAECFRLLAAKAADRAKEVSIP